MSRRLKQEYGPLKIVSIFHSYQILVIIGGLAGMIPILIAISNMDLILEIIDFYTGRDLSGFVGGFRALGIISTGLCFFAIVISFVIKKSKRVGRILFFFIFYDSNFFTIGWNNRICNPSIRINNGVKE